MVTLLSAMGVLLAYCGWIVAGPDGIVWASVAGAVCLVLVRRLPADAFLKGMRARLLLSDEAPGLHIACAALAKRAGLSSAPKLYRIKEKSPIAFSLGGGNTAAIVVTDCVLAGLTLREQCGILAHEISHLRRGDLTLQQLGLVLGWVTRVLSQIGCIFVLVSLLTRAFSEAWPLLLTLLLLVTAPAAVSLLRLALSREREAEADLDAAKLTDDPAALASALAKLRRIQESQLKHALKAKQIMHLPTLFGDHPPTDKRIRALSALSMQDAADHAQF